VKVSEQELENLWQLQGLIFEQRRLVDQAKKLSSGQSLREIEDQITKQNEVLRTSQMALEKLQEGKRKLDSDLALVEKRIDSDMARMNASSSTKDIAGIQHEIDGLQKRKSMLEDSELELMEELDQVGNQLSDQRAEKQVLEGQLTQQRAALAAELSTMKDQNQKLNSDIGSLREGSSSELLALFDAKLAKGNAIGRLVRSACTACNMNLTSTALGDLSEIPTDELATCPECTAIVIRA
jgi:predicted  nucleic acid-binding Zn-ribbon protein